MKLIALLFIALLLIGCTPASELNMPVAETQTPPATPLLTPTLNIQPPKQTPIPTMASPTPELQGMDPRHPIRKDAEKLYILQWDEDSIIVNDFDFALADTVELKLERTGPTNELFSGIRLHLTLDDMPYAAEFQHETIYSVYPIYIDCIDMDGDGCDEFILCLPFPGTGLNCDVRVFSFKDGCLKEIATVLDHFMHTLSDESADAFERYYDHRLLTPEYVYTTFCHWYYCIKKQDITVIRVHCTSGGTEMELELTYDGTVLREETADWKRIGDSNLKTS